MQDMEIKELTEREHVECPACGAMSFNPKFLTPSRKKKELETGQIYWLKEEAMIRNLMWEYIFLQTFICKQCGCNFTLPIRKMTENEYELKQKEKLEKELENTKTDGKGTTDNGKGGQAG